MRSSSWSLCILVALLSELGPPVNGYGSSTKRCFQPGKNYPKPAPRIMYIKGQARTIVVETTRRPTHRLISHIFKILVTELLGYQNVTLRLTNNSNVTDALRRITSCASPSPHNCSDNDDPQTMVNLELWLGPGYSLEPWLATGRIIDCGPLGPIGRSGWFVPLSTVERFWEKHGMVLDHWRSFRSPNVTVLMNRLNDKLLHEYTRTPDKTGFLCNASLCVNGIYEPPICRKHKGKSPCATLIADYPESTYYMLTSEIESLKLRVNVAWVGKRLEEYVTTALARNESVVFYNWKPNTLTTSSNVVHIAFPQCEDRALQDFQDNPDNAKCEFEVNHMEKVVWSKLKDSVPDVYDIAQKISFKQDQYEQMLDLYKRESTRDRDYSDIACTFLTQNEHLLHEFVTGDLGDKPKLYIGGIFPVSGIYKRMSGVLTAARMAMDAINRSPHILSDFRLVILEQDGQCAQDVVMKRYIGYVTNSTYKSLIGILGPACTETLEPIVGVAKHYNTAIISYSAEGALFSKREKYPYFFRTIPENHMYRYVYMKLLDAMSWRRVAALTEDGHKYSEYLNLLHDDMQKRGLTFITNRKFPHDHSTHNATHHRTHFNMSQYLADLKARNARIIIGGFDEDAARAIMCEAYKQGMTGAHGYQWFLPTWLAQQEYRDRQWYNTEHYNKYHNESVNCTVSQMRKALEGYMSLHPKSYADDNAIMQENRTVGDWKALYKQVATAQGKEDSEYGGYAYDAVWVFALALEALFQRNHSHTSTLHDDRTFQELISLINETNFNGVSGHVRFYKSSRLTDVLIKQWVNGTQVHVGTYNPGYGDESDKLLLGPQGPMKPIFWPSGSNPGDGSEDPATCPLEGLRSLLGTSCDLAIVVANVIGLGLFALIMIGGCIIFKQRYEKRVKQTEARMRELGLLSSNNVLSLDGWEMPRDYIVINRKLGEGAFGTVYGGEAFVPDKGWVAVAVKTLKVGAIVEEKLDFLSEAEMMKRFDHKNIVRLLGVCTSGEPVYTVMEFMLYGDLKTYLLARRHLVKETNRNDSEEVSDKCLTAMALDVARGLSYLADLKYVHRDLACRNCLVNAGRTVKIGDFGMCRPMYDSDYYRFNKRGMLPVRWMAPESLIDGIFTTMSDVWSYGVLLYEIVTFASFPYQGLSNNQVLDFVKNFNTLPVPNGCKPELEALLFRCWTRCAQQRPTACEIVEILANDSSLISPCLDLPLASVQVEGTDSLELTSIGDRNRLHSISSLGRKAEPPPPLPLNDTNRAPLVNAAAQQPGSPSDLPRSQYVTLRQSFRSTGQVDGFAQCSAQNMTSL
uniref:Gamma-aminobutyric acid type B receptor subunit 2 n=2 Tax=Ixodes ricinus TaxID=34613 RepID=V5IB68_IXORI